MPDNENDGDVLDVSDLIKDDLETETEVETDEVTTETDTESETATETAPEEESPKIDADKQNVEKKVEQQGYELAEIKRMLEEQRAAPPATVEKPVETDLDKILAGGDEFDDPRVQQLAQALKAQQDTIATMAETVQTRFDSESQNQAVIRNDFERRDFATKNPDIADQYDALIESAKEQLAPYAGLDQQGFAAVSGMTWKNVVEQAQRDFKPADETDEIAPVKTTADKSTDGTKVLKGGTSTKQPKNQSDAELLEEAREKFMSGIPDS